MDGMPTWCVLAVGQSGGGADVLGVRASGLAESPTFWEEVVRTGQLAIDFEYDERTVRLATEVAIMLTPYMAPGTPRDDVRSLAERIAKLSERRFKDAWEPKEAILCHTCDEATTVPGNRVRVAVCNRCSLDGSTPGSSG
jgi:hypothetical protein